MAWTHGGYNNVLIHWSSRLAMTPREKDDVSPETCDDNDREGIMPPESEPDLIAQPNQNRKKQKKEEASQRRE